MEKSEVEKLWLKERLLEELRVFVAVCVVIGLFILVVYLLGNK